MINNRYEALPFISQTLLVDRENDEIVIAVRNGVILRCAATGNFCSFKITPFYRGRVMGLWGTFTGESADDYTLPNGKVRIKTTLRKAVKSNTIFSHNALCITRLPRDLTTLP